LARARLAPLLFVCGLALPLARPAYAQNPAAAEALFDQARAAMAAGNYDVACARFRDSNRLDPAVGTRFNLADCEERRGRVATAWSLFRGVLAELGQDDDRRLGAEERARALEPRIAYVTLRPSPGAPPGSRVRIDGVELGEGSFGVPLPMDPIAHDLVVVRAGEGRGVHSTFRLREGERRELPLGFGALPTEPQALPPKRELPVDEARLRWAYVAGAVGGAGAAVGAVTGIITLNKKSTADANCNDQRKVCNAAGIQASESGKTFAALSAIGLGVGVIGLATGAYLWLTASEDGAEVAEAARRPHHGLNMRPELTCSNRNAFLSVTGSF
jgi:hypothetical protein